MKLTYSHTDLPKVANQILTSFKNKTFLFYGKMGVGKTTLIKEIIKQLGVKQVVGSPTFSIVNEYETPEDIIYHFDFYRINDIEEAYDMGIEDYFYSGHYILVEWPEKIESILPDNSIKILIENQKDGRRVLTQI